MSADVREGQQAPDFELATDGGGSVRLSGLRGHPAVVYFYPKDDTRGCTLEARDFTQRRPDFDAIGARIVGISADSVSDHDQFKAKHSLDLTLAADEGRSAIEAYGVWVEKSMYGRKYMGIERATFLIDENGVVRQIWRKVKVPGHAEEVLAAVKAL